MLPSAALHPWMSRGPSKDGPTHDPGGGGHAHSRPQGQAVASLVTGQDAKGTAVPCPFRDERQTARHVFSHSHSPDGAVPPVPLASDPRKGSQAKASLDYRGASRLPTTRWAGRAFTPIFQTLPSPADTRTHSLGGLTRACPGRRPAASTLALCSGGVSADPRGGPACLWRGGAHAGAPGSLLSAPWPCNLPGRRPEPGPRPLPPVSSI